MSHAHAAEHERIGAEARHRLTAVFAITAAFVVIEGVGGYMANSLTLLADAGHMLTDVGALALNLFAIWFAERKPPPHLTYGLYRVEVLVAQANGGILVAIAIFVFYEAYHRLTTGVHDYRRSRPNSRAEQRCPAFETCSCGLHLEEVREETARRSTGVRSLPERENARHHARRLILTSRSARLHARAKSRAVLLNLADDVSYPRPLADDPLDHIYLFIYIDIRVAPEFFDPAAEVDYAVYAPHIKVAAVDVSTAYLPSYRPRHFGIFNRHLPRPL